MDCTNLVLEGLFLSSGFISRRIGGTGRSSLVLLVSPEVLTSVNNAVCCVLELIQAFNLLSA